jgi:hypothetical protein
MKLGDQVDGWLVRISRSAAERYEVVEDAEAMIADTLLR